MATRRGRRAYHHGNLAAELLAATVELARSGGPEAVTIRGVARHVGVSPSAVYRHFTDLDTLLGAAGDAATEKLADSMHAVQDLLGGETPGELALNRLRGVGLGYIAFALDEPGWFSLIFSTQPVSGADQPVDVVRAGARVRPYALLVDALDELLAAGVITAGQRDGAEWSCWSSVHGFAALVQGGPLRSLPRDRVDALAASVAESSIVAIVNR